jgi:hypothetical protein
MNRELTNFMLNIAALMAMGFVWGGVCKHFGIPTWGMFTVAFFMGCFWKNCEFIPAPAENKK